MMILISILDILFFGIFMFLVCVLTLAGAHFDVVHRGYQQYDIKFLVPTFWGIRSINNYDLKPPLLSHRIPLLKRYHKFLGSLFLGLFYSWFMTTEPEFFHFPAVYDRFERLYSGGSVSASSYFGTHFQFLNRFGLADTLVQYRRDYDTSYMDDNTSVTTLKNKFYAMTGQE